MRSLVRTVLVAFTILIGTARAHASQEAADLKRQIETQQAGIVDLQRLDAHRAVEDEITRLRSWLDEAFSQHAQAKWDHVRELIDRCLAQAELIRQKINVAQLSAQLSLKTAELKQTRERLQSTRASLEQATIQKKAMEITSK